MNGIFFTSSSFAIWYPINSSLFWMTGYHQPCGDDDEDNGEGNSVCVYIEYVLYKSMEGEKESVLIRWCSSPEMAGNYCQEEERSRIKNQALLLSLFPDAVGCVCVCVCFSLYPSFHSFFSSSFTCTVERMYREKPAPGSLCSVCSVLLRSHVMSLSFTSLESLSSLYPWLVLTMLCTVTHFSSDWRTGNRERERRGNDRDRKETEKFVWIERERMFKFHGEKRRRREEERNARFSILELAFYEEKNIERERIFCRTQSNERTHSSETWDRKDPRQLFIHSLQ